MTGMIIDVCVTLEPVERVFVLELSGAVSTCLAPVVDWVARKSIRRRVTYSCRIGCQAHLSATHQFLCYFRLQWAEQ